MGSVSLSIKTSNVVNTTIIIPSQFSPILPQLISELASDLLSGIGISSVYLTKELKPIEWIDVESLPKQKEGEKPATSPH